VSVGDQSIPVQLILMPPVWNAIVFQDLESLSLSGCLLPVVSWRALARWCY
jgi:hypothetical protein